MTDELKFSVELETEELHLIMTAVRIYLDNMEAKERFSKMIGMEFKGLDSDKIKILERFAEKIIHAHNSICKNMEEEEGKIPII